MRRLITAMILVLLPMLGACQTKGEKKAPCPPLTGFAESEDLCGPVAPVNTVFEQILQE
ncbi:hypothetical protein [Rhizobium sp. 18055]|uniref:hypothetical protein n=1 Tax=Rhizobium sp. 18055 TaxID=2681403 RepID=UPI001359EDA3|nr:hypothetical protein [Rhizobium sp. 18055]